MKIYVMDAGCINLNDTQLYEKLSDKRIEKLKKIKKESAKQLSAAAEILLNIGMEELGLNANPVQWDVDKNGKPYLIEYPEIHFNLTHSGNYAVCVISDKQCGIDIQYMREVNLNMAERFFTPKEKEFVEKSENPREAFYEIWVRKESFVKAVGTGITIPLNSFCVLDDVIEYNGENYSFQMQEFEDKEYKLCVCYKKVLR